MGTEAVAVSKEKRASGEELDLVVDCVCKGRDTSRWEVQELREAQQLAKGGCKWGGSDNRYIRRLQLGGLALGGRSRLSPRLLTY